MGRHVDDVAGAGHEPRQPLGAGNSLLGLGRLHRVDVQMAGARMVRILLDHALQEIDEAPRLGPRLAVGRPVVPGTQVHDRVGREHGRFEIVGKAIRDFVHGSRVGRVQGRTLDGRHRRVACRQGVDERRLALARVGLSLDRRLDRVPCGHPARRVHRRVDVRAVGVRDPPVADRALRIDFRRLVVGPDRLGVIEAPHEPQPLIEILLGEGIRRGDLVVMLAEIVE